MNRHFLPLEKGIGIVILAFLFSPSFSQLPGLKAVNDTIDIYPGIPVVFDILANDSIPPNVRIKIIAVSGANHVQCQKVHDTAWRWVFTFSVPQWGFGGEVEGAYHFFTMAMDTSSAKILYRIHDKSYNYLDINNVRARFSSSGSHFFHDTAEYEVPKRSGKTSVFSNTFWIGGKDNQGKLHFAGERYRQGPAGGPAGIHPDFYAGPIMDSAKYSVYQDTVWNYVWSLKKTDIDYHRAHFWDPGYQPIHDILTWPGNGDTALGQAQRLAPFSDRNGDGIYNPFDGDYPEIRGDQALFFIFNDDRGPHYESAGLKLRVEIHGMAYAFDMPDDSAFKNTIFLNYKLFNRSQNTFDSTLLGIFTDIDLGYANDDYVLCDVERNMYIGYNGTPVDGTGQTFAYGESPPAQAVTLMAGPLLDADGLDNPRISQNGTQLCDFSVNGLNFGDNVIDNERYGLQRFIYVNNSNSGVPSYMTDPEYDIDYYQLMCGKWKDGTPITYGGNGHPAAGGYGPACRFMFPGESDSLNWGAGCVPPNGPKNWTEETAFNNPGDRRGIQVTGPVTFSPGDVQELDLSFNWARAYGAQNPMASVEKLRHMADKTNSAFALNRLPGGSQFYGIDDAKQSNDPEVTVYPNPAGDYVLIKLNSVQIPDFTSIELMDSQGKCLRKINSIVSFTSTPIDISDFTSGIYFVRIQTATSLCVKKLVVIH